MLPFAPGFRAEIRGEEWLIRRVNLPVDGGWFLNELEYSIRVLDPAKTQLVPDTSPTYNATLLYLESWRFARVEIDSWIKSQSTMPMDQSDD